MARLTLVAAAAVVLLQCTIAAGELNFFVSFSSAAICSYDTRTSLSSWQVVPRTEHGSRQYQSYAVVYACAREFLRYLGYCDYLEANLGGTQRSFGST